ncbi:MAG: long-chain fatty acid--CoA ligase [Acidobacteria bacterium]|nr:long-chain fatty acid--CoA ligase [Acidobacteriota bacterium]
MPVGQPAINRLTTSQTVAPDLRQLFELRREQFSDKVFLFSELGGWTLSYQQIDRLVNQTANLLKACGVGKGNTVSLLLSNCVEYVLFYFACWKLGALAGPINAHLKGPEITYILNNSEAVVLATQASFWPALQSIRSELECLDRVILIDERVEGTIDYRSEVSRESDQLSPTDLDQDDEAIIIYTSGTTGKPKGVLLTHRNLVANARQIAEWLKFDYDDRFLCIMPLFHMNAVAVTTLAPLYVGASMVLSAKFSASRHWQTISDYGVTTFGSVATMLSMLLNTYPDGIPAGLDTSRLKFAMCGSAPVPVPVMEQFEARFHCPAIEGYGLSESTCRSTFNPPDARRRLGSVGLPIGNEMKIFDDADRELPPGQIGEIVLRGENIMKGYYKNPDATRQAFRSGWFHTGDVGYRDEDGFFYVVDRKSDMIIRGGENIYPREIDEVLYQHPAVKDAATIGVPDELYGEEVKAFVVLKDGMSCAEDELIAFCRARLADYKCPKTIQFLDDIPKGPTGKLLKRELAKNSGQ